MSDVEIMDYVASAHSSIVSIREHNVRLMNTFIIGPLMVWAAIGKEISSPARTLLGVGGVFTILYNFAHRND